MAKRKTTSNTPAPTPVIVNSTRGVGYLDWLFLETAKGARFREKYLELKAAGLVQEDGPDQFLVPRSRRSTYFGTALFRNQRAMIRRR